MAPHMPPTPPANRNEHDSGEASQKARDSSEKRAEPLNTSEQGDTANIKQNTTNKGFFQGRRIK